MTTWKTMVSAGTAPGEMRVITMDLHRQCGGEWIDQDGGEVQHVHRHDAMYCSGCDGHFCETHYNDQKALCYSCAGDDAPGSWDLH